jgi:hypothetical protein
MTGLARAQGATPADTAQPDPATRTLPPPAGGQLGTAVDVQELMAPDPNGAGALPAGVKPLGMGMWKSIGADDLAARLERLPTFERSPTMQSLTQRMLLSPSSGPKEGKRDGLSPWFVARLRALVVRGDWEGTIALAAYGPQKDPSIAEIGLTAQLMAREDDETCATLREVEGAPEGEFWSLLRVYCQFVGGDVEAAQLAIDVLREKGVNDPVFFAASAKLLGGKPPTTPLAPDTVLQGAFLRLAGLPFPLTAAKTDKPEIAGLSAVYGENEMAKLGGLGTLARRQTLPMQEWLSAVASAPVTADQKDDPEDAAAKLPVGAGDALYMRSFAVRTLPAAKASAFAAMLQRGQSRGEFPYTARLLARAALEIAPLPETAWAAPEITRVLVFNGEIARAESWFKALNPGSPSDQPTINAVHVYSWIKQPNEERAAKLGRAVLWLAETANKPGPARATAQTRLAREAPILAALGVTLPAAVLNAADLNSPGIALDIDGQALLDSMAQAADQGAAGEVVLNAGLLLRGQGAAAARSQTVAAIIRALNKVGLRPEGKALALEALLGVGQRGL